MSKKLTSAPPRRGPANSTLAAECGLQGDVFGKSFITTIDAKTNDKGYLVCMRGHFPGYVLHTRVSEGVENILQSGQRDAAIVGHGDVATLVMGEGQSTSNPDRYVSLGNWPRWRPQFERLKNRLDFLKLHACYTGAENDGATLLYMLARIINGPVVAPTGLSWCGPNGTWLDPGAVWQFATPSAKPNPIQKDPEGLFYEIGASLMIRLIDKRKAERRISAADVKKVAVFGLDASGARQPAPATVLSGADAVGLLSLIAFARPFVPGGVPGAVITGFVRVTFKAARKPRGESREFRVYANRLLQDAGNPGVFYRTAPSFERAFVAALLSR